MTGFNKFLLKLGLLHDCTITSLDWQPVEKKFVFEIADFYWNFEGLPEYRGPQPGRIALEGVKRMDISIEHRDALRIYEFEIVEEAADTSTASVTFSPAGRLVVTFERAAFPDIPLP